MSQVEMEGSLEEAVDRLSAKARRAKDAQDLESRASRATQNIQQLCRALRHLEKEVSTLLFYDGVATEVVGENRSAEVRAALESARDSADIADDELIDAADEGKIREMADAIDECASSITDAKAAIVEDTIRAHKNRWDEEIAAATDLDQIIGGGTSGFDEVLDEMETFLSEEMWDESRSPSTLGTRWNRLVDQWEENAGRHGWEEFQREHRLEDETIATLQQFADKGRLRLNDLSMPVLEELKSVEELDSAIRLEIDTR